MSDVTTEYRLGGLKTAVGRHGIWSFELRADEPERRGELIEAAAELDELGYGAVWLGGSSGVRHAVPLIEATSRLTVATGILSIWQYEAADTAARFAEVEAAHPGRFLLGLGVSHAKLAEQYRRPYAAMAGYLDALDAAGVPAERRVLAALGPKMLKLSGDQAAGSHPYLVTPEHTADAREILGEQPLLAPELKVVLETDPDRARTLARGSLAMYLELPNYTNNFLRYGFTDDDFADGGSDRLIDALFAWGDEDRIRTRIADFHAAGADHVALQVVTGQSRNGLPRAEWRRVADLLA
ncbi:LLM class F420-dependent oxidoreductase [Streptomyces cavernae]|uniref:LLM class F420-dependent oxidoreductase n=1 Tax=Streptomyces cavernae TaxID=2259034 RepID=UPI000FEB81B2|nr:LLM class F420-dependent oxidoreductase [Streptomyces cavernae]